MCVKRHAPQTIMTPLTILTIRTRMTKYRMFWLAVATIFATGVAGNLFLAFHSMLVSLCSDKLLCKEHENELSFFFPFYISFCYLGCVYMYVCMSIYVLDVCMCVCKRLNIVSAHPPVVQLQVSSRHPRTISRALM